MVRVEEDTELKRLFLEKLREHYGKSKDGFFVTDFVYCIRKAYWRRVRPKAFGEQQLGFFVDGSRRHEALQLCQASGARLALRSMGFAAAWISWPRRRSR